MEKKFEHDEIEVCNLCKKNINTKSDNWISLIDYSAEKEMNKKFYHTFCLTDLIKGKGKIIEDNWKNKLKGLMKNFNTNLKIANQQFISLPDGKWQ